MEVRLCLIASLAVSSLACADSPLIPAVPGTIPGRAITGYSAATGEIWVDDWYCTHQARTAPNGEDLAYQLKSASGIFTNPEAAEGFDLVFDHVTPTKLFKMFPSGSLGRIADPGFTEEFLLSDLEASGNGRTCDAVPMGFSYFPHPNLVADRPNEGVRVTYRAVTGQLSVTATLEAAIPWFGLYSAAGSLRSPSPQPRDIESRMHYVFGIDPGQTTTINLSPRLSLEEIGSDLTAVASTEQYKPAIRQFDFSYVAIGDVNEDLTINAADIDTLTRGLLDSAAPVTFDLDGNGQVDSSDRSYWVSNVARTHLGDSNLDGQFDSSDLTTVFEAAEYRDGVKGNSTWSTGDWNGDSEFDSRDLVAAFREGAYNNGPRQDIAPVPETVSLYVMLFVAFLRSAQRRRRT